MFYTQHYTVQLKYGQIFWTALITPVIWWICMSFPCTLWFSKQGAERWRCRGDMDKPISLEKFQPVIKQEYSLYIPLSFSLFWVLLPSSSLPSSKECTRLWSQQNPSICVNSVHSQLHNVLAHSRTLCEMFCWVQLNFLKTPISNITNFPKLHINAITCMTLHD